MNGKDVLYELVRSLSPEDHHRYQTNAFFRQGVDQLALGVIPTFIAGLRAEADKKQADINHDIAQIKKGALTLGR